MICWLIYFTVNGILVSNIDDNASCELRVGHEIEDLFGDGSQCWIPDSPIKHYVGQIFTSIDDAFNYYNNHASFCGFEVHGSTQTLRNGVVISKYFVCSKTVLERVLHNLEMMHYQNLLEYLIKMWN